MRRALLTGCLLLLVAATAHAQVPNPGTHFFESEFVGSASHVFSNDTPFPLVEGWIGSRNPLGDHGGTPGSASVSGGTIQYQGGQGNFSDELRIEHALVTAPASYLMQVRFRRLGAHSNQRADFIVLLDSLKYFVGSGPNSNTGFGYVGGESYSTPFPITGEWYTLEVIWAGGGAPPDFVRLTGGNLDSPGAEVDWIYVDPAGGGKPFASVDVSLPQIRLWPEGSSRPVNALTLQIGAGVPGGGSGPVPGAPGAPSPLWLGLVMLAAGLVALRLRRAGARS